MGNENLDTNNEATETQATDNQSAPETGADQTQGASQQSGQQQSGQKSGTSSETEKPEFSDPNMQARFTQRMTELKQREKEYNDALKKAQSFDAIRNNPELVEAIRKFIESKNAPKKVEMPQIDETTFLEATTDPAKFAKLLDERAKILAEQMFAEKIKPIEERLGLTVSTIQEQRNSAIVSEFAANHPDFWDLDNDGKGSIEGYLKALEGTQMSLEQKLEMAYKLAKSESVDKVATQKAHQIVTNKKTASGEKGSSDAGTKKVDNRNWEKLLEEEAEKIKW